MTTTPKLAIAIGYIDDDLVSNAVTYTRTIKKNGRIKWTAIAACIAVMICANLGINHFVKEKNQHLLFNEVASVTYSAPLYGTSFSEEVSYDFVSQTLGYDIISLMPKSMQSYDFMYTQILSGDGTLLGLAIEGYQDRSVYQSPGIYINVTFGKERPIIDFDFENPAATDVGTKEFPVQAYVVPEHTITSTSGEVKIIPAFYSVSIDSTNAYYYFESRGKLSEKEMEGTVISVINLL